MHPTLEKVCRDKPRPFHLSDRGEYATRCGRNREEWRVIERASLSKDLDDPNLCQRCRDAILR